MKLIIAGSRPITGTSFIYEALKKFKITKKSVSEIVSGCAKGPDTGGKEVAEEHQIKVKSFPADWNKFGNGAGYKRNIEMGNYGDKLLAIWDGSSSGTEHMINTMKERKKETCVCFQYIQRLQTHNRKNINRG